MPSFNTYHHTWVSLILDKGYLLSAAPPDLECGVAPLGPPGPRQPPLLGGGVARRSMPMRRTAQKHGGEELPLAQGQGRRPRAPGCDSAGAAQRRYPTSEARDGGQEALPHAWKSLDWMTSQQLISCNPCKCRDGETSLSFWAECEELAN